MRTVSDLMLELIAYEVCGTEPDLGALPLSDEMLRALYKLSKAHDLAHLVGNALIRNGLIADGEIKEKFEKQRMLAVYRYQKINYELNRLREILNKAQIPFIPLKGSVIRQYYPEPWMRTSCDIDILVREEQVDAAAQIISEQLQYTCGEKNYHDISLMSEGGVHLELHYSIKEAQENLDKVLVTCWNHASLLNNFEYGFDNAFFFFYQIAHTSHHFLTGGCGVRPVLDVYLLEKSLETDKKVFDELLSQAGIQKFYENLSKLSEVWFGEGKHDDVTEHMEQFILFGGVYGNTENAMAVKQQHEKGRFGYVLHRIWLPFEKLCTLYPNLRKRRYLQPFYEVKRWFRIFDPEARKRKSKDMNAIKNLSAEKKDDVCRLLKELELM